MWLRKCLLFCVVLNVNCQDEGDTESESEQLEEGEHKLSENILMMLEHFKEPNPVGLPGAEIPDPYPIPPMKHSTSLATMHFENTAVYGISKFRILYVNAEIKKMEVQAALMLDAVQARGDYFMTTWIGSGHGPFTVDITGLKIMARATLDVNKNGKLVVKDIVIDLGSNAVTAQFENLGMLGGMLQSLINNAGSFLFDSIKPYILEEAYIKARNIISSKLDEFAGDLQFPNSISPLDMVIIDARNKYRDMQLDPYQIKDYNKSVGIFTVRLFNTLLTGISSFHRIGNITFMMENNTFVTDFEIGTQKLEGQTQWDVSAVSGLMSKTGSASFSVEYINARIVLAQPVDTRKNPVFRDLKLDIGNIQVRCDGLGTLDYIIEFGVNVVPNLLRYQLISSLENPIRERVQEALDRVNVELFIKIGLHKFEQMQDMSFQNYANTHQINQAKDLNGDDFFNFYETL
ncbi:uncharacterized protein LOC142978160 [Anticarsia gemmatalis]|uniref:uncharacterized protein LOC142978160 n=1 Tax=Anticarsia gemmatalis TaxID=129554 RepID=UPI003F7680B0